MKRKDYYKIDEGCVLLAFGLAIKGMSWLCLIMMIIAVLLVIPAFSIQWEDVKNAAVKAVPYLLLISMTGLAMKIPLLVGCIMVNVLVSEMWSRVDIHANEVEIVLMGICLSAFLIIAFISDDLVLPRTETIFIILSVFMPPLTASLFHLMKMSKRLVKVRKTV